MHQLAYFICHTYALICKLIKLNLDNTKFCFIFLPIILFLLLLLHGDIEFNPGPKKKITDLLFVMSLECLVALLPAYYSVYRYDIICISESFLDSTISDDDNNLHMDGYNLIRADHPENIKRRGVCLYFKKSLVLRKIELSHIAEFLLCKVNVKGQVGFIMAIYSSPGQTDSKFDDFYQTFYQTLR